MNTYQHTWSESYPGAQLRSDPTTTSGHDDDDADGRDGDEHLHFFSASCLMLGDRLETPGT